MPKANAEFWKGKLKRNQERDIETDRFLHERGWEVVRVWEHEEAAEAADRVEDFLRARRRAR